MKLGRGFLIAVVLLALPVFGAPKVGKTVVSANGLWVLKLTQYDDGRCRFEAFKDDVPSWQLDRCVATVDDLYFPSNDGKRFWVLFPFPQKPAGWKIPWWKAPVAFLYESDGTLVRSRQVGDLVVGRMPRSKVDQSKKSKHLKWMEGAAGVKGRPPRLLDSNEVEFETVEPKTYRLKFE